MDFELPIKVELLVRVSKFLGLSFSQGARDSNTRDMCVVEFYVTNANYFCCAFKIYEQTWSFLYRNMHILLKLLFFEFFGPVILAG